MYPPLQHALTAASNLVPFALLDVLCVGAVIWFALFLYRSIRTAGWRRGTGRAARGVVTAAAVLYLLFLFTWGLNYRRVPLTEKLAFDAARTTPQAADRLAAQTVDALNRLYAPAHARPVDVPALARAFQAAQQGLAGKPIVPGRPKGTLLGGYFHQASIGGMTDPFLLEILLAPDLLEVEKSQVIAHEWAHLAGYADESEANFVSWLTCMRGDDAMQYSAWLVLLGHVRPTDRNIFKGLAIGPRTDLFAISARYQGTSRLVQRAARESYDKYLKANRVAQGIQSYDAVVQLIVGTTFDASGRPVLRPRR